MRKFRATTQPEAAKERVFYGRANDPDIASRIVHGVNTKSSLVVRILFESCFVKFSYFLSSIIVTGKFRVLSHDDVSNGVL